MEKKISTKQTEATPVPSFAQKLLQLSEKKDFKSLLEEDDLLDEAIAEVLEMELEQEGSFENLGKFLIESEKKFLPSFLAKLEEYSHQQMPEDTGMPPPESVPPGQSKVGADEARPSDYSMAVERMSSKALGQQGVLFENIADGFQEVPPPAFSKKKLKEEISIVARKQQSREFVKNKSDSRATATFQVCFAGTLEYSSSDLRQRAWLEFLQEMQLLLKEDAVVRIPGSFFKIAKQATTIMPFYSECHEGHWANTLSMLSRFSSSAVAGKIFMWKLSKKEVAVVEQVILEGNNDRKTANFYDVGKYWAYKPGKEACALRVFDAVIRRVQGHASAYERRGYTNFKLNNFEQALQDFNKSIEINKYQIDSFFGRAATLISLGKIADGIKDLNFVKEKSMTFQIVHWTARLLKGQCHLLMGEYDAAESELEPCVNRFFDAHSSSYLWQRTALICKVIYQLKHQHKAEALNILKDAIELGERTLAKDKWFEQIREEYELIILKEKIAQRVPDNTRPGKPTHLFQEFHRGLEVQHKKITADLYMETERIENLSTNPQPQNLKPEGLCGCETSESSLSLSLRN